MKKLFSLTLSLLMLIACSLGTVSAFAAEGITPNIVHLSSQLYMIKEFISSGFACGFMFRDIAETIPNIKSIPLKKPIKSQVILIWSKERQLFNNLLKFINYAKGAKF